MAELVLPPGFAHVAMTVRNVTSVKPMLITDAFDVLNDPYTQTDANTLALDLRTQLAPLYDPGYSFGPCVILVGQDGPPLRFEDVSLSVGTRASQTSPPPQVSYLIKKSTNLSGRQFRGRAYWPFGGPTTAVDERGTITAAEQNLVQPRASAWRTALNKVANNTNGQVLLHSVPLDGSTPPAPTAVTAFVVEGICATQRRRLVRTT
jgi:hypothetical protein